MTRNGNEERPLPDGWVWTTLGEVAKVNHRDPTIREMSDELEVTFVPMAAVEGREGKIVSAQIRTLGKVRKGYTSFSEGDVLFAKITPCMENGKVAIACNLLNGLGFGSTEFHVMKPGERVLAEWLFYYVRQLHFRDEAKASFSGTAGQLRVKKDFLISYPLPLPSLLDQECIVAEIEKQFSRLDTAVAALHRLQNNLTRYKASVLKAACEGRLVPQDPNDEPASDLLARILTERRARWEAETWQKLISKAQKKVAQAERKTQGLPARLRDVLAEEWETVPESAYARYLPKNDRWQEKYKEPQSPKEANLPELPFGWVWTVPQVLSSREANAICAGPFGTIFKAKDFRPKGVPIIFLRHVQPGHYAPHRKPRFMDAQKWEELFQGYSVYGGELLITKLGEPPGVCAIYPKSIGPAMVTPDVMKMTVNDLVAESKYLMHYFNSEIARQFSSGVAFGTTRLRLTLPIFREMPVPLPPLAEQKRIVAEVERRLSIITVAEQAITANLARAERLRQAILHRAFTGRLVPQDDKGVVVGGRR